MTIARVLAFGRLESVTGGSAASIALVAAPASESPTVQA